MTHTVCHDVGSWVNQNVQQQLEQCIERPCNWWCVCCNKWLCALAWVIVTIAVWVVQTICEIVADVVDLFVAVVTGLIDIFVGLFTGNWARMWDGLVEIAGGIGQLIGTVLRTVTLGGLVGTFIDTGQR